MTISRRRLRHAFVGTVLAAIATAGCADTDDTATTASETDSAASNSDAAFGGLTIDVRRDPGCGCCTSWVEYLRTHGATVELTEDADRESFRAERSIADEAGSCHTAVVDGCTIEGHVPVAAIHRLLAERPDAVGLALPGMPLDSPGMGGDVTTWERQAVMLVSSDGDLNTFEY